jgi:hypothetical protein
LQSWNESFEGLQLAAVPERITCNVPAKQTGGPTNVLLTVSNASGQERFHAVDVIVNAAK